MFFFQPKPTTVEILEGIDKDIQILEEYSVKFQQQMKTVVGRLLLYSILLYVIAGVVTYSWYLPEQLMGRLVLGLPFLLFPLVVWILRKLLIILFARRTEKNNLKLEDLKTQKRKILEDVMETETYKNAKMILERFDTDAKKKMEFESTLVGPQLTPKPGQELRHRNVVPQTTPAPVNSASGAAARPPLTSGPAYPGRSTHSAPGGPPERNLSAVAAQQSLMRKSVTPGTPIPGVGLHPPGPPLARPVLPRERGALDRVIEYLVGDGPQNRFALICQQCLSHNGMALKEEFEYVAFRCAYCYFLNPARKTRPQAPRLPETIEEPKVPCDSHQSSSAAEEDNQSDLASGTSKHADGSAETDSKEPATAAAAEVSCASEDQPLPESQDVAAENSAGEHDCSAMEVE
uniref:Endoplasmic reticulum junction formation protein lunapark n=1 Tax=Tetraodon nigroviridis TaxID=99883 RepID=H3C2R2_TETNG